MSDNVTTQSATPATPPSGTVIATDDVGGVQYQRVKLVDGTLDSSTAIPGDATNGLDVDVTRVSGVVHVDDNAASLTVDGTVTANAGSGPWPITDNSGSLTVDAPVGTPVWVRLSDGSVALVGQKTMAASLPVVVASDQSSIPVAGDVASGVADSGNPVKTGGVFNTTPPTLANGQRGDLQLDSSSILRTRLYNGNTAAGISAAGDGISGVVGLGTLSQLMLYDGSGLYNRARGDIANGLDVDVTRVQGTVSIGGDGLASVAPKVQNRAGDNVMFVYDPAQTRLLEEMLVELRVMNAQQQKLLVGTLQADVRPDLKLAV